jgi:hypothetical protein
MERFRKLLAVSGKERKNHPVKKLFPFLVLMGALHAVGAWGAIVYSAGPAFYAPINSDGLPFDINQDGTADVSFSGKILSTMDIPPSAVTTFCSVSGANGAQLLITNGYAQILSSGEAIVGGLPGWSLDEVLLTMESFNEKNNTSSGWLGPLGAKGKGFLGVQFSAADGIHYGWIQVTLRGIQNNNVQFSPGVVDWAYETAPNTPIKAGQTNDAIPFVANFAGANAVPPNHSIHFGRGTFLLERYVDGDRLAYHLALNSSFRPASAGIFGPASPGRNARLRVANLGAYSISYLPPPVFPPIGLFPAVVLPPPPISVPPSVLIYDGQVALNRQQAGQLLAGQCYVNFPSAKFRQGELRGQIFPALPVSFSAALNGRNEVPRNASPYHGAADFSLSGFSLSFILALDIFPFTSAGIYASPLGVDHPFNLIGKLDTQFGVENIDGAFPGAPDVSGQIHYFGQSALNLTDEQVVRLKRGDFYLNVLTSRFPRGEIGGRILPVE